MVLWFHSIVAGTCFQNVARLFSWFVSWVTNKWHKRAVLISWWHTHCALQSVGSSRFLRTPLHGRIISWSHILVYSVVTTFIAGHALCALDVASIPRQFMYTHSESFSPIQAIVCLSFPIPMVFYLFYVQGFYAILNIQISRLKLFWMTYWGQKQTI